MTNRLSKKPLFCNRCDKPLVRTSNHQKFCPDCIRLIVNARTKQYYHLNPEKAKATIKRATLKRHEYYLGRAKHYGKIRRTELRRRVLEHYSFGQVQCACCTERTMDFLTIDHINGGGNAHRKSLFGGREQAGPNFYAWLIKNAFPEGYQVLCMNCNFSKGKWGMCVHKKELVVVTQ